MDLLEREQSLADMRRLLLRAEQGFGGLLFIGGEAGIEDIARARLRRLAAGRRHGIGGDVRSPAARPHVSDLAAD